MSKTPDEFTIRVETQWLSRKVRHRGTTHIGGEEERSRHSKGAKIARLRVVKLQGMAVGDTV